MKKRLAKKIVKCSQHPREKYHPEKRYYVYDDDHKHMICGHKLAYTEYYVPYSDKQIMDARKRINCVGNYRLHHGDIIMVQF